MTLTRVNSANAQDGACDISEKVTCNCYAGREGRQTTRPSARARGAQCALSWSELAPLAASYVPPDQATGPIHSQALVRTFGQPEASVRVTLYESGKTQRPAALVQPILPKGVARHKLQGGQPGNVAGLGGCTHVIQ
jgi:hypothetical protein